jgi:predicted nucleotidyltransferase
MKKSLAPLPKYKREELKLVTEIILDECPTVLMIILFGSYTRGDWVEDTYVEDGITYEYASDFDILVIVRSNRIVNSTDTWRRAEARARRFPVRTWTNLIVESIETVNNALIRGHYFFTDIRREGILVYDTGEFPLARPRKLNPKERRGQAKAQFREWFASAKQIFQTAGYHVAKRQDKWAAFDLHQATERFYGPIPLVFAGKTFTPAQRVGLSRIREHLVANLSIDREDFEELPVFTRHGGWLKVDQDFGGKPIQFLHEVNEAIAA